MARDGLPNVLFAIALTAIPTVLIFYSDGAMIWRIASFLAGAFLLFTLFFFRDPERDVISDPDLILSPGDGNIVNIREVVDDFVGPAWVVTMFLSPLNVHINRIPISGKISWVQYHYGSFKAAFNPNASEVNERNVVALENDNLKITFAQIAGVAARRIISHLREGDEVEQGQRYGLIKFGSRMDVVIPRHCEILVGLKEPVRGGLTALAKVGKNG